MSTSINQDHKGSGDNVAGDKIIYQAHDPGAVTKKYLTVIPASPETFIGREEETVKICSMLQAADNPLVVRGMGGLGKSTIAKVVLDKLAAASKHVAWIDASQGLKTGFTNSNLLVNLKIPVADSSLTPAEQTEELFQCAIAALLNMEGRGAIVVDNLLPEEDLAALRSLKALHKNWQVLITSRFHFEGFKEFKLGFLTAKECMKLFYAYYLLDKNDAVLETILRDIGYHTLTAEMMSKTGQKLRLSITDIAERINQKGLNIASKSNIAVDHSAQSVDNIQHYMLRIFALGEMSPMEETVLKNFAVINSYDFAVMAIYIFMYVDEENNAALKDEFNLAVSDLIDKGWFIIRDPDKKDLTKTEAENEEEDNDVFIKMHPLIQELVRLQLKPTHEDCKNIVAFFTKMSLAHLTAASMPKFMLIKIALATNLSDPVKEIFELKNSVAADYIEMGFKNDAIAILDGNVELMNSAEEQGIPINEDSIYGLAYLYSQAGAYQVAADNIINLIDRLADPATDKAADLRHRAGDIFLNLKNYEAAKEHVNKALAIRQANYPGGDISLAQEYKLLGQILQAEENIITKESAEYYVESYNLTKKFAEPGSFKDAMAEIDMAIILASDEVFAESVKSLLAKGIEIFKKLYVNNAEELFYVETAAARTSERINDLQAAQDYYKSAIGRLEDQEKTSAIYFSEAMVSYARFTKYKLQDNKLAADIINKACAYQELFIDNAEFAFLREARDEIVTR
jgi:hypothetical protein